MVSCIQHSLNMKKTVNRKKYLTVGFELFGSVPAIREFLKLLPVVLGLLLFLVNSLGLVWVLPTQLALQRLHFLYDKDIAPYKFSYNIDHFIKFIQISVSYK